jgi:hypothetical protein
MLNSVEKLAKLLGLKVHEKWNRKVLSTDLTSEERLDITLFPGIIEISTHNIQGIYSIHRWPDTTESIQDIIDFMGRNGY